MIDFASSMYKDLQKCVDKYIKEIAEKENIPEEKVRKEMAKILEIYMKAGGKIEI